ncbi:MAG: hypothetical protein ACFFE5_05530 [Candidatus Thorarchaeota archaeon]
MTKAKIQRIKDISSAKFKLSLLDIKNLDNNPFLLIIQSIIENSIKLSIYPLNKEKIIKITFSTNNFSKEMFDKISEIFQNYQIIHTSGVLNIENQFYYESYLNLNLTEAKVMGLNDSLNKIKNIFKQIKIEEIGLKKHK